MKKLSRYMLKKVGNNLDHMFNRADESDIEYGMQWYKKANDFCNKVAIEYGTTSRIVAQVLSALSPRNKWDKNLIDTVAVLEAVRHGLTADKITVSTFHKNKFKAFRIARGEEEIKATSQKTYAFVHNIALLASNSVTIDVWHLRACFGETKGSIGKLAYEQIESLTIKKAKEVGLKGYQYQAIIWSQVRNNWQG